jgi:ribosome-associated heat shock protein Hsp15
MNEAPKRVRVDKWLWAVRIFKTRSLATEACKNGHVKISGTSIKPSREVKPNEVIEVRQTGITRTMKVLSCLGKRLGAKVIGDHVEDLTPTSEYERLKEIRKNAIVLRPRGAGRPTKRDRRKMEALGSEGTGDAEVSDTGVQVP